MAKPANTVVGVIQMIGRMVILALLVTGLTAQINPSTRGPRGATGAAGPAGPTGATGPAGAGTQAFAPISNAGTDVICALGGDTITGLPACQVANGTSATAFAATTTIPAGTLTTNVVVPVDLAVGYISSGAAATMIISIKLGTTVIFTSASFSSNSVNTAGGLFCTITAGAVASTTTPLVTGCHIPSNFAVSAKNTLLSTTTKSIAVNTTVSQVLSVTVIFGAATAGNAVWLYSISPGGGGAVGPTGPAGAVPNFVTGEVPAGVYDGVNVTYTLAHTPTAGSLELFLLFRDQSAPVSGSPTTTYQLNGTGPGGWENYYSISGAVITLLTGPGNGAFPFPAFSGFQLRTNYRY